jgi:hypothetical protein
MPEMDINRALKNALSILPNYIGVKWASIIDTNRKSLLSIYSEHSLNIDRIKNQTVVKDLLKQNHDKQFLHTKRGETVLYSPIVDQYALLVNLSTDIPSEPVEKICEHVKLVLREILTKYDEVKRPLSVKGTMCVLL